MRRYLANTVAPVAPVVAIGGILLLLVACGATSLARAPYYDRAFESNALGERRAYRVFLPRDYDTSDKSYPVIYYCHGHSDRYTLEKYDGGAHTVPAIADYVAEHDVIVVSVDGYVAEHYSGFYGGEPWDLRRDGGDYDFGRYFRELVDHVDGRYRTLTDRRNRATTGLSMGGFNSLFLSARYPEWIGSASAFNPAPELFAGEIGRRVLWRLRDHAANHGHTKVRLICASGDYIRQYHEMQRDVYARSHDVDFEYRQDEYHRHWATSIAETFDFHRRAFDDATLDTLPVRWSHTSAYRKFDVWGYEVQVCGEGAGLVQLAGVTQGGLRVTTRQWMPDGPPAAPWRITIVTPRRYRRGATYRLADYRFADGKTSRSDVVADNEGRIRLEVDGAGHQLGLGGPGTGDQPPAVLPWTSRDVLRLPAGEDLRLPIRLFNPRSDAMDGVAVELTSDYPTVRVVDGSADVPSIGPGEAADPVRPLRVRLTAATGGFAPARLTLRVRYDGWHSVTVPIDLLIEPEGVPPAETVEILDGRRVTLPVFQQRGNQGGGGVVQREVEEGRGNGNGVLDPGEEATVWIRLRQGLDPFDKNTWHRCKVRSDDPHLAEVGDIQESKGREWTGGQQRSSLIRLAGDTPAGRTIPLRLDAESWSFHFTPDVRYGTEPLYQAFQFHQHHLRKLEILVP